jgi:DNA primase
VASRWLDFKAIKAAVPIRDVLTRYGYLEGLTEKGHKLVGPCPLHGGGPGSSSFHVDTRRNIWKCFSTCDGGGNVIDLVMVAEGCEIRDAAKKLAEWFGLSFERPRGSPQNTRGHPPVPDEGQKRSDADADHSSSQVNPPLERPLTNLNADHPYLVERGLTVPTIRYFGLGLCSRGLMQSRIAIPVHNEHGELVAYAGRAVSDDTAESHGRYKLPKGFEKSHVLFNLHRAKDFADRGLIVVEGFFDSCKVYQAGFPNVVALMGSSLSERQEELLAEHSDRLDLMFDGDAAGTKCLRQFYARLRRRLYLREIHLEDGEQPDSLSEDRIRQLLS